MYWSTRSNRWATYIFSMVVCATLFKILFAFASKDVGGHIAMAFMFLLGSIILLVVPAYFIGMLVDKYKKEEIVVSNVQKASPKVFQPDIVHSLERDNFHAKNKMSDNKQENAMVNKVSSDKIINKPVVEPKTINLHYGDTLPSDQINVSQNRITKGENLKPLVTKDSDTFYAQAWDEINDQNKEPVKALWAKSFADAQGNESLAKANYLKLRVEHLTKEYEQNIGMEKERQLELMRLQDALAVKNWKLELMRQQNTLAVKKRELEQQAVLEEMEAKKKEIGRDDKFIAYDNGTVLDTSTNLMWAVKDNGSDINWEYAKEYCENYHGGGYTDWRMPTLDELESLYDKSRQYNIILPKNWTGE